MKPILAIAFLAVAFSLSACYQEETFPGQLSDEYYLRHKGADLPVWVRGNASSSSFIIFLHGGPGGSSMLDALSRTLRDVTDAHPIVFYDQRLSGFAHGERNIDNLSADQMTEDLDVVVEFVKKTYNPEQIFLMGHSWGGFLGTAYLANPTYRAKITGWIDVAGAHSFPLTWQAEKNLVKAYADSMVAAGEEVKYWQKYLDWHQTTTELKEVEDLLFVNRYAHGIDGNPDAEEAYEFPAITWILSSPAALTSSQNLIIEGLSDLLVSDPLVPVMNQITTPSLFLFGKYDAVVPPAVGEAAFQQIGTPAEDKFYVLLEEEGHSMWSVNPSRFAQEVTAFVALYE